MVEEIPMNTVTMLGTYMLDGDIPVDPEIVLANCTDTVMLGQLVSLFQGNPDIRFFLLDTMDETAIDMAADFHFLKDSGNWVLANNNTMLDVKFDDADFNPSGTEGTFSLVQEDGGYAIITEQFSGDQLLVDLPEDDIFQDISDSSDDASDTIHIDQSVLAEGENEIVVTDFTVGSDHLELGHGLSVKDVTVDTEQDFTQLVVSQADQMGDHDIIVKLMGTSQPDIPIRDYGIDQDTSTDDLINHLIQSGTNHE